MKRHNLTLLILGACLLLAGWTVYRLASYHAANAETVRYIDGPSEPYARQALTCGAGTGASDFDIRDFSYNVTQSLQPAGMYRYKTNLDAVPPAEIHILWIQGGSGRVVLEKTDQPVWLVLISTQSAIWHVQSAPGAKLERVIANERASEIRYSRTLTGSVRSIVDLLFTPEADSSGAPIVDVLPDSNCFSRLSRFQEFEAKRRFIPAIQSLRTLIGHPELSLQASGAPSYFDRPFHVPFSEPRISAERLAEVLRSSDPPRPQQNESQRVQSPREAFVSELQRYANMPRDESVVPKTLGTPAEFVSLLQEYQQRRLLPSSLPKSSRTSRGLDVQGWYSLADYRNAYRRQVPAGETTDACNNTRNGSPLIIEGTNGINIVKCAWGNQLYFLRDGDDEIDDSWEDDIIDAGPGDDLIDAGWGNDVIFFNFGWGQDTVEKTCTRSAYIPQDSPGAAEVQWSSEWPYKNFLVFGKDVRSDDIVVVGDKLVHRETGDSVTLNGNCFNLVFWG